MEQYYKKSHIPPDERRKERVSADTGHRKDVKKGGAGGKTVWGKEGDEANYTADTADARDPNYNSEEESGATLEVTQYEEKK